MVNQTVTTRAPPVKTQIQTRQKREQCGFAGAGHAHHRDGFAPGDFQTHIVQYG